MTTEQRVDRLEQVLEELLAGQKRLEAVLTFMAVKLLTPDDIQEMADMVRGLDQG